MVVAPSPVVPGNQDGSVGPISGATIAGSSLANGIDDRCYPRGTARWSTIGAAGVIGISKDWGHPAHVRKLAGFDVFQYISGVEIDIRAPFRTGARNVIRVRLTYESACVGCVQNRAAGIGGHSYCSVIFPAQSRAVEQGRDRLIREAQSAQRVVQELGLAVYWTGQPVPFGDRGKAASVSTCRLPLRQRRCFRQVD